MTKNELNQYNQFLLKHIELTRKRAIRPLYRGDSLKNLCKKLNVNYNYEKTDIKTIVKRLFMVGEKAKRYYLDGTEFSIDTIDNHVFEKIATYFENSLGNSKPYIASFFNRNTDLKKFFSDQNNRQLFSETINNADASEKLIIRNYYLTLLHQLATLNYKNKSHFVSTSEDYEIAQEFSNYDKNPNRVILHCWQPIKRQKSIIKKHNLPSHLFDPFPFQKETSLLGGIFPHFIWAIEITLNNKSSFHLNPAIFKNVITDKLFINGLEIDQSNFDDIINLTKYKRTIITDGINMWEQ